MTLLRWWFPLVSYLGAIFYMSSLSQPRLLGYAPDYAWHFLAYFILGLLAILAFEGLVARGRAPLYGVVFSLLYAFSDEWHQSFVPGRMASGQDLVMDSLGIVAAAAALFIYSRVVASAPVGGLRSR
jgi:VanZ family protein